MRDESRGVSLMTVELGSRVTADLLAENTPYIREVVVTRRIEAANPRAELPTTIGGDLSKYIDHYITLKGDDEKGNIYFVEAITTTQDDVGKWNTRLSAEACYSPNDEPKRGTKWLIWPSQVSQMYPENVMDWQSWEDMD